MRFILSSIILLAGFSLSAVAENEKGTFFLKEQISVSTESGVTSLPPGTKVTSRGQTKEGTAVRTSTGVETVVKESQLTSDPAEGERLAQQEVQAQIVAQAQIAKALEAQRLAAQRNAELLNQSAVAKPTAVSQPVASTASLQRTPIQYKAVDANVTVIPPTFKKKKKK